MDNDRLYEDIGARTGGELYLGVVGPVRTGKSTFLRRMMDLLILPDITDEKMKARTMDELPLSAPGTAVTTVEPKFIPKDQLRLRTKGDTPLLVKFVDCVGYMIQGENGGEERMVKTPWLDYEIPFSKAAEIGTTKVIRDHSTMGVVVTTDGSIGEIPREAYTQAEERAVSELKDLGKPFVILLNSTKPYSDETLHLSRALEEKYGRRVLPMNVQQMKKDDALSVLQELLEQFPVQCIQMFAPKWVETLERDHPIKAALMDLMKQLLEQFSVMQDSKKEIAWNDPYIKRCKLEQVDYANGIFRVEVSIHQKYYYEILSEMCGTQIPGEYQLIHMIRQLASMKQSYAKCQDAMDAVHAKGYGIILPDKSEIRVGEPELVRHGNKYGVRLRAVSPSIHLIRADVETEIAPIVGSEEQAKDLVEFIKKGQDSEEGIWQTNIFGKSIEQLVEDGMRSKITLLGETSQAKLQDTMKKIVNDSNGGMVCIII